MTSTPEPIRALLAAIADTLDVPAPAPNVIDEVSHRILVNERIVNVQAVIGDILTGKATHGFQWEADYLRRRAGERPVPYRTREQAIEAARGEGR